MFQKLFLLCGAVGARRVARVRAVDSTKRLALHTSHQVALASHIVRMNIARYVAYFLTYFLVGLLGLLAVLVVWSSAPWPGRLMPWTLALCILAATAFLSASVQGISLPGHGADRSEEHTSELQSHLNLVCRLLLEKKNTS